MGRAQIMRAAVSLHLRDEDLNAWDVFILCCNLHSDGSKPNELLFVVFVQNQFGCFANSCNMMNTSNVRNDPSPACGAGQALRKWELTKNSVLLQR